MVSTRYLLAFVIPIIFTSTLTIGCQVIPTQRARTYVGRVIVSDTEEPIRGAKITLEFQGAPPIVYTDSEGIFRFTLFFEGDILSGRVKIEAPNYEPYDRFIELSPVIATIEDIRLSPAPRPTPTMGLRIIHPVIRLSRPIERQLQLFPTDKIQIWSAPGAISEIHLGLYWEPFEPGREYIVGGLEGTPVIPQFRGRPDAIFKTEIKIMHHQDEPRDLR